MNYNVRNYNLIGKGIINGGTEYYTVRNYNLIVQGKGIIGRTENYNV